MVDIEGGSASGADDYPDDCDDYYGLSEESDKDDVILRTTDDVFSEDLKCRTLKSDDVEQIVSEDVNSICQKLKIPWWLGSLFLRQHKWDIRHVEELFINDPLSLLISSNLIPATGPWFTSDSPEIMQILGVVSQRSMTSQRSSSFTVKGRILKDDLCPICFSPPSSSECVDTSQNPAFAEPRLFGMSCGHMFCLECWKSFFNVRISSSHVPIIECMDTECTIRIPDDFILAVLNDLESALKHRQHILNEVIKAHPRLRPCTDTHCTSIIYALEAPKPLRVTCETCGTQFCFSCSIEYHAPAHCETIKQWLQKCRDDSGTANYMAAHTKDCPNCGVLIEKNGGCNHMQCFKCQHQFCWVCLGPWQEHPVEYYNCSKYRKSEDSERESKRTRAREYLQRYLFYYERWENHERSLRLEEKHYASIQARIQSKMQNGEGTWIDWQYLLTAADTLRKCRYTLKYTYPYAYYPPPCMSQRLPLFEYQQALLEAEVEDLSWKIARAEITERGALLNKMNICEKHRRTLIQEFY
uniref:RBR-type E3 ubiquitin transferase n=2 Tax=Mesocestoides corti TaxID=53468 RepID=A0A5K3FJ79_MESCO